MKTSRTLTRNLFILVACLGILVIYAAGGSSEQSEARANPIQVQNKTKTLEVVSVTEQDSFYLLTLRNDSTKTINGYSIGVGSRSKLDVDLTIGEKTIPPGAEFKESIPASKSPTPPAINILAVLFTDSTGDGDPQVITANQQRREGTKAQLKQLLTLLRATLNSPAQPELGALKKQIAAIPARSEGRLSPHFTNGMSRAKQDTVSMLETLEPNGPHTRRQLTGLIEDIEKRISRL